ncbi:MAG: nucleotidyltransferase family protein [Nocardioides sp.]
MRAAAVVLAAGSSRRLGRPKQLLPYRDRALLDATLDVARASGVDQVVIALGGAADEIRERVDLSGAEVVLNRDFGDGCATSIRSALDAVRADVAGVVLLLGDQPGVRPESVSALLSGAAGHRVGVCAYADGLGHPLWFSRDMFETLRGLRGDKAIWKLVDAPAGDIQDDGIDERRTGPDVVRVPVPGDAPRDVDTWEDYRELLAEDGRVGR